MARVTREVMDRYLRMLAVATGMHSLHLDKHAGGYMVMDNNGRSYSGRLSGGAMMTWLEGAVTASQLMGGRR